IEPACSRNVFANAPGATRSRKWPSKKESISVHSLKRAKWPNRIGLSPSSAERTPQLTGATARMRCSRGGRTEAAYRRPLPSPRPVARQNRAWRLHLHGEQPRVLETAQIAGDDRLHSRVRLEARLDEALDRARLHLQDVGRVLLILLQERDVAVVVPELGAVGDVDDPGQGPRRVPPQWTHRAVGEAAAGLPIVAVGGRLQTLAKARDHRGDAGRGG